MSAEPFKACPKCSYEPLPADQRLPAACPSCSVILAKLAASDAVAPIPIEDESEGGLTNGLRQRLIEAISHVPERVEPVMFRGRCFLLLLFTVWGVKLVGLDYQTGEMMSSFIHGPLLVFHEAGHVIFGLFGEFMTVLGGSLAQLVLPAVLAGALLLRNRDPFGAAFGTWFFGASLLDLAPYIYDSLQPQLILLGGHTGEEGGHDWIYLLSETGLLKYAHGLGSLTHKVGVLVMLLSAVWAGWILLKQKARIGSDEVRFE